MEQPAIAEYALLSDGQTTALVARGQVDWWCVPRVDSQAVFARLVGTRDNGAWGVVPQAARQVSRGYREGSFVLDTCWRSQSGAALTTDYLSSSQEEVVPSSLSLIRRVSCTAGSIEVDVDLVMRFDYGATVPWVRRLPDADGEQVLHAVAGPDALTLRGPVLQAEGLSHGATFSLTAGQSLTWMLTWSPSYADVPTRPDAERELAAVLDDWARWRRDVPVSGRFAEETADSLAVLRALTVRRTGGIVAAATTSLPERVGGERNWDYRFAWLRDSALTISVLASRGHPQVAAQWREWLLRAIAGDADDVQIMYGVGGERLLPERTLTHLAGYRGSTPVRVGNGAYRQYQADVVGEVMMALDRLREAGLDDDEFSWPLQVNLLRLTERRLGQPDHGIWEMRGEPQFFTHGRVMMWAAFDRGVRAVEEHGLPGPAQTWRRLREELQDEIWSKGVNGGVFVQHYGTDAVDAALLQIPHTGFVTPDAPVMLSTMERIERELVGEEGLVQRYRTDGRDGLRGPEGRFLMCSFWLVEQYARSGRRADAERLMSRLLDIRTDLGLLAEEYDPGTGELLGNMPQAFSHLALIRAARALEEQDRQDG